MTKHKGTALLCILDGWGYSEQEECNAIHAAKTEAWDALWSKHPHTLIRTHGAHVGLPKGQMGNSEVGHMNIGAGRVIYQEVTRINRSIRTKSFFSNRTLTAPVDYAIAHDKTVHIMGLMSVGGVHSHANHIEAMVRLAVERGAKKIAVHAFLDGRDTAPRSAKACLEALEKLLTKLGVGRIVSIIGRYYALDRDARWERVKKAYDVIIDAKAEYQAATSLDALQAAYDRDESDEFVSATVVGDGWKVEDGDVILFMNFRSDRARELTEAIVLPDFKGFRRARVPKLETFVTLTEYKRGYPVDIAFPADKTRDGFGEHISNLGYRQLRIAETEKYAHVTFFFNGGREEPFAGEDRILIQSPDVATYDLQPEMSAKEVTSKLVEAIRSGKYDAIVCNFANSDMVGHTGNMDAAVKAIEVLDDCIAEVVAVIKETDSQMLMTADHGNSEQMCDFKTGGPFTSHTTNLVPLVYVGANEDITLSDGGCLADLAPTMLDLMGIEKPEVMTGVSLVADDA